MTPDQSTEESETTQLLVTTKPVPADSFNEYNKNFSSLDFDYDYDNNISFIDFDFSPDYEYSDEILSQSNLNSTDLNFTTLGFSLEIFIRSLVVTMLTILFLLLILALITNTIKLCKMCKPTTSVWNSIIFLTYLVKMENKIFLLNICSPYLRNYNWEYSCLFRNTTSLSLPTCFLFVICVQCAFWRKNKSILLTESKSFVFLFMSYS